MSRQPDRFKNVPASVRARLLNVARRDGRDFGSVLRLFFLEAAAGRPFRGRWDGASRVWVR